MSATTGPLAHLVGDGAHVSSGRNTGAKNGAVPFRGEDFEFVDFNLNRLKDDIFLLAREFVSRNAVDLFCGKWRWGLFDHAAEMHSRIASEFKCQIERLLLADRVPVRIISVGGKAEADHAF